MERQKAEAAEEGEGDGGGRSSSGRLIATDGDLRLKRTSELLSVNYGARWNPSRHHVQRPKINKM